MKSMKAKITIEGRKVQDVGYRYFLAEAALSFGIERFRAVNVGDNRVVAFVEAESDAVNEFYEFARSNFPSGADVEAVRLEDYDGYIPKIESFALVFNIGQSRKFIEIGQRVEFSIKEESQKTRDELRTVIVEESEKTRETIKEESQKTRDELRTVIVEESEKTRETIKNESKETRTELGGKVDMLRGDLRTFMEKNTERIYKEISEIKQALRKAGIM